jgi:hypothetical protein
MRFVVAWADKNHESSGVHFGWTTAINFSYHPMEAIFHPSDTLLIIGRPVPVVWLCSNQIFSRFELVK